MVFDLVVCYPFKLARTSWKRESSLSKTSIWQNSGKQDLTNSMQYSKSAQQFVAWVWHLGLDRLAWLGVIV